MEPPQGEKEDVMKFRVTFKDPDVVGDAIERCVSADVATLGLSKVEAEAVAELRAEKVRDFVSTWVSYGEYITVEFDTDARTIVVVPK